jgi:precorrin-6A synthase
LILDELDDDGCGAFLVWGDPSLYDSTLRIIEQIAASHAVAIDYQVIPGISSVQALAARHRIALNRIGEPVEITTGRQLAAAPVLDERDLVVLLDGNCAFSQVQQEDVDIYWAAYLGTADELLISGRLQDTSATIQRTRAEARARKGWIMDTYLLRKSRSVHD